MRSKPVCVFAAGCLGLLLAKALIAGEPGDSRPIQNNSFLIEEAYNQEEGVIQHIFNYQRLRGSGRWQATFTQEWPVSGVTHQVSYTLPAGATAAGAAAGAGDAALNYRYQALGDGEARLAVAPRLSLSCRREMRRGGSGQELSRSRSICRRAWFSPAHSSRTATRERRLPRGRATSAVRERIRMQ